MTKTYKYVVFDVSGGIGKHIAATAVISNVKAAYPDSKLIVVAAWPRVFNNHPDIWRTYGNGEVRYFHDEYIKDKDFLFFKSEPYHHTDYIKKERHLIDVWTEQCGVPLIHTTPKIYLTTAEEKTFKHKYQSNRPLLLLQSNGGTNLPFPYSWVRDMPPDFTINLVNILKQHFQILHLRNNNHPQYGDGVTNITVEDIRELFGIIKTPSKKLFIDSCGQHACAALGETSMVLWPIDNVKILGYETNINIVGIVPPELQRPYAYIEEYRLEGVLSDYPFDTKDIFNVNEVAERIFKA